jgi:hypothetical protein
MLFLLSFMFFRQQNQRISRGQNRFFPEGCVCVGGEIVYTHVNKCKNNKIKLKINKLIKTGTFIFLASHTSKQSLVTNTYFLLSQEAAILLGPRPSFLG